MDSAAFNARLADVAREVQASPDLASAASRIVEAAADLVGEGPVSAGLSLVHRSRRLESAATTSDVTSRGDALQYELGEGPCLDAIWQEDLIHVDDLGADPRWPRWGRRVVEELDVSSMLCVRLFTSDRLLGALNLYGRDVRAFDGDACDLARLLSAHAAVAVAAAQEIDTLKIAVDHRTTIGKALGLVMAEFKINDDQAMAVLRKMSSHGNRKLFEVAEAVVDQHRDVLKFPPRG